MSAAYVNPLPGIHYKLGRTDQGLDIEADASMVGKPIVAIGAATVVSVLRSYQGFGQWVAYRLDSGPRQGTVIYIGHSLVAAGLKVGDQLNAGDTVATIKGFDSWPGHIEMGFADPQNPNQTLARAQGSHSGLTVAGAQFKDFYTALAAGEQTQPANQTTPQQPAAPEQTTPSTPSATPDLGLPAVAAAVQPHASGVQVQSPGSQGPDVGIPADQLVSLWGQVANQNFAGPDSKLYYQNAQAMNQ